MYKYDIEGSALNSGFASLGFYVCIYSRDSSFREI